VYLSQLPYKLWVALKLRGLSELYAALILLITSIIIAPKIIGLVSVYSSGSGADHIRPVLVVEINETHALCYVVENWEPYKTKEIIGDFRYWVYLYDVDGDGFLDPVIGSYEDVIPRDTYVLVSPPIVCTR
jgi:hypothetical protein